jgi:excisionase family DNA binding protein
MTIGDVADHVNVSVNTVRSWVKQDRIPYLKAGQLLRFDPDEVDAWLRARSEPKVPA